MRRVSSDTSSVAAHRLPPCGKRSKNRKGRPPLPVSFRRFCPRPRSVPVVVAAAVRSRVLRVALGLFGRVLGLAGQLRRLTLFARDLRLRLAAQARLELLLMAQLLLGGVLLVPLLTRGRVLGMPLEQLRLSPQCGFSSTEEGNLLTEDEQWAKVALVKRIAERVWG